MPSDEFTLENAADAGRLWIMDLIHSPRALPPLSADLNGEFIRATPMDMDSTSVNGYAYSSPRSMAPPVPMPELPPGQALLNWETGFLPETRGVYERFRNADYSAMDARQTVAFIRETLPATWVALANTVVSAMQLGPDAERLANFLDVRLGAEGDLVSATILHGSGSQTRSLGDEVQQLAEMARQTAGVEAALRGGDFAAAMANSREPWARSLRAFLQEHEDELALWSEMHRPAWNEDPIPLMRLVGSTVAAESRDRHDAAAAAIADVRARLSPEDMAEFEAALALSRDYVPVIEHRARWQLKLFGGVRRSLIELGKKLVAGNLAANPNDVFFLRLSELEAAASGELDIPALVATRKAEWQRNLLLTPPLTLGLPIPIEMLGAMSPIMRRMFGAVALPKATATVVSGIAASRGIARGRARIVRGLDEAEDLVEGDILVCPSTSPPWTPYFAVVAAIVTDAGGVLSHAAIEAREYGIPAVVGTREATRLIPEGAMVTVDGGAGTVTIG